MRKLFAVVAFAVSLTVLLTAQQPQLQNAGQISGVVVDGVSRRPIADARVMLRQNGIPWVATGPTAPVTVLTGSNGTFLFSSVQPGEYVLSVTKTGYSGGLFGQQSPQEGHQVFDLRPAEKATGVSLVLWPGGSISGTVRGSSGEPLAGRAAQLVEIRPDSPSQLMSLRPSVRTDDRGNYWFGNLPGGLYLVRISVRAPGLAGIGVVNLSSDPTARYYPNDSSPSERGIIRLDLGEQRAGIDVDFPDAVDLPHAVQVSGKVSGLSYSGNERMIRLVSRDRVSGLPPFIEVAAVPIQPDGSFIFRNVPAGNYQLRGLVPPGSLNDGQLRQGLNLRPGVSSGRKPASDDRASWFSHDIIVRDQPVTDLVVQGMPGMRVFGKVVVSPDLGALDMSQVVIVARSNDGWNLDGLPIGWIEPDGTFASPALPAGRHTVEVYRSLNWSPESVILNGRDARAAGIEMSSGDVNGVVITIARGFSQISGRVTDDSGRPRPDAHIVFFKKNGRFLTEGKAGDFGNDVGRIRTNRFGEDPVDLAAGEYLLAAGVGEIPIDWRQDSEFLRSLVPRATGVSVPRNASTAQNLRVQILKK